MSETPDVNVTQSETYKDIYVTGQISNLQYDGLKLTIIHDTPDLSNALAGDKFKGSKAMINREIECTLILSPLTLKLWTLTLQRELKRYENLFGIIPSPEEIQEKFKNP